MQLKQKSNIIWMTVLAAVALLIGIGIQLVLGYSAHKESRAQAESAARSFTGELISAAEGQKAADMRFRELLDENYERKNQRAEELKALELLMLVNPWNPLPEGYVPELASVGDEQYMDARCAGALLEMLEDCREAGGSPYICSAYRTQQYQQDLYDNKILRLILAGVDGETAPAIAAQSVAVPGTSEHQLGLAVDIIDQFYTNLDAGQEETSTQKWLMENSWRYGFILRYPNGSTDITGIIYEPWHYRYVGEEFAREIYELDVTLEEYLTLRRGR